ncbi:MAG: serine protease [Candidatus Competibacteraceae bacterium]|nr:serine protease [Candidatus Competibacteraceae bacterium]MCB1815896.1 serine protease [Candidatus Competibacteraceae bacterium]
MSERDLPAGPCPRPEDVDYDLDRALSSVVFLRTRIPEDALTADVLGTERSGHGVVIQDSGLIVTIGYLITEAEQVWIIDKDGGAIPGYAVGFDQASGFGLVQALQKLKAPPLPIGSANTLSSNETVVVAGHGGRQDAVKVHVAAKQEFAGYWEYMLDEAIFTHPAHPNWGGAALIGPDGTLRGIGSLLVQTSANGDNSESNMIVPIDLLLPVMEDLQTLGRPRQPPHPWLGMMTTEMKGNLVIINLVDGCPAELAGVQAGDVVLAVNGQSTDDLATFYRLIRGLGPAGTDIPLTLLRHGETVDVVVHSVSRYDYLKKPGLH